MHRYGSDKEISKYETWNTHETLSDTKDFVWWQPNHKIAEIKYVISNEYWGKGLTTELAKKIIAI